MKTLSMEQDSIQKNGYTSSGMCSYKCVCAWQKQLTYHSCCFQSSPTVDSISYSQNFLYNRESMELLSSHYYRIHSMVSCKLLLITILTLPLLNIQCSFLPRFIINVETCYEDNAGTNDNVFNPTILIVQSCLLILFCALYAGFKSK